MSLNSGLARAHRLISLAANQDTSTLPQVPTNFQPGWEAKGWKDYTFMVWTTGTVTGLSLLFYGTTDPNTARAGASNWFILTSPADQTNAGNVANPITATDGSQSMRFVGTIEAFRIKANAFTGGGIINIDVSMAP